MPKSPIATRFLLLLALLLFAICSGAEAQQPYGSIAGTSGPDFRSEVEKQTFLLVNQYRKESELPALAWDGTIAKVARTHSKDMATGDVDFGHDGFSDRIRSLKATILGVWGAGENVLYTSELADVAKHAVTMWLHSPHHLKNIRGDYNFSGLGVWQDKDGTIYFTQIFVKTQAPMQETQAEPAASVVTPFGMLATPETRTGR